MMTSNMGVAAGVTNAMRRKPMARPMPTSQANPAGGMTRGFPGQQGGTPPGGEIDGAIQGQMQQFLTGGMPQPRGMTPPPGRLQRMNAPPAWQQLQAMGMGGQGSAAANKAMLASQQGGAPTQPQGSGPMAQFQGGVQEGSPWQTAMQAAAGPGMGGLARAQQQMDQLPGSAGGQEPYAQAMTSPGGGAAPAVHQDLLKKVFAGGGMAGGVNGGMR